MEWSFKALDLKLQMNCRKRFDDTLYSEQQVMEQPLECLGVISFGTGP